MIQNRFYKGIAALAVLGLILAFGCGKKGPPLPPLNKARQIAAPYGLKVTKLEKDARLTWKHKVDPEKAKVQPENFEIFMATKTSGECEGCPVDFELIGTVDMPVMEFYVPVKKGIKYYFRVQATDEDKLRSAYSATVQLYDE